MHQTPLNEGWEFRRVAAPDPYPQPVSPKNIWRPASVPGHVHLDLAANGVIGHPFEGQKEAGCQWVDYEDWEYRLAFSWSPKPDLPKRVIRFDGLDTCCVVSLNGEIIGRSDNMFIPSELDVTDLLKEGENELSLIFYSAIRIGEERRTEYFAQEGLASDTENLNERAFVRKAQYMYGWDWGPRLVSCGIWKQVELEEYAGRIKSFSVHQERQKDGSYKVWTRTEIEGDARFKTRFGDHRAEGEMEIVIENPKLWEPNGHGEPHLYEASAEIEGQKITKRIGLRTIELVREPDAHGESFRFRVNGKDVWARGANWIPNDSFPSKVTAKDYREQIALCKNLNFNMVRVWGGGLYESDDFYDACDEFGILVWQDYPFGCSYYPDDEAAQSAARIEAQHHVTRLQDRASLALWCGNNENLMMWDQKWGNPEKAPPRYYGDSIFRKVLPEVLDLISPAIPYIESSPVSAWPPKSDGPKANDGGIGDQHYWDVWHGRGDWKYYVESTGRFVSEFGFASSCSTGQWLTVLPNVQGRSRTDQTVRWHNKTLKPFEIFSGLVAIHYPDTDSLEDWIYYSQLNQRDALRFGIERFRSSGFCDGALIWQINDCWPVESWAVQEYSRRLKPAGFELRRLYAKDSIAVMPGDGGFTVYLLSDCRTAGPVLVEAVSTLDCSLVEKFEMTGSPTGTWLATDKYAADQTALRFLLPGRRETERWQLLAEPKDTKFGKPAIKVSFSENDCRLEVQGLLFDAIIVDADDPNNVPADENGLAGFQAHTLWNEALALKFDTKPKMISVRWLGGRATF